MKTIKKKKKKRLYGAWKEAAHFWWKKAWWPVTLNPHSWSQGVVAHEALVLGQLLTLPVCLQKHAMPQATHPKCCLSNQPGAETQFTRGAAASSPQWALSTHLALPAAATFPPPHLESGDTCLLKLTFTSSILMNGAYLEPVPSKGNVVTFCFKENRTCIVFMESRWGGLQKSGSIESPGPEVREGESTGAMQAVVTSSPLTDTCQNAIS